MPLAKPSLIRCENLDLFAAPSIEGAAISRPWPAVDDVVVEAPPASLADSAGGDHRQLDLFRDSPAAIAAVETRRALCDGAAARARRSLALLRAVPDYAAFVADGDRCLELLERTDRRWADTTDAVAWIEHELRPAAERCLAGKAMPLLRPALMALLEACEAPPGDLLSRHAHPAYLWQMLGEPAQALAAIERAPDWRTRAPELLWHAELSEQAGLEDRVRADILDLCLTWPASAETWLGASQTWESRWSAWCELDEALPISAFPAWARLVRACEFPLPAADDPRPGADLLHLADRLARNGNDVPLRKALHTLSPTLLAVFLAARTRA